MKIPFFLLITLLIFTGFIMTNNRQEYHPSKGEQLVHSILGETAKIIKEKYNLKPCGSGTAMPGGPIQEVTLCFDTKFPYTKNQLRELLIKTAQELLNQMNEDKECADSGEKQGVSQERRHKAPEIMVPADKRTRGNELQLSTSAFLYPLVSLSPCPRVPLAVAVGP